MKQFSQKLIGILSCLLVLATLSIFGQNDKEEFNQRFNKKPLQDFAANLNAKLDKGEVDLDKPFSVTLEGYLTKEGRFDVKRSKFTKSEGDEKMVQVAKEAIGAVGDTGLFSYLVALGVEKFKVVFFQNDTNVSAVITCEQISVERARVISSGLSGLFAIAKFNIQDETGKTLLNNVKTKVEDRNCLINFTLPKSEAHRLLKNELQKAKEKSYSGKVN